MIDCRALQWGPAGKPLTPPLNLHLPCGSLTAITGRNGSGKSSLLKVLAGLQKPLSGELRVSANRLGMITYLQQQQPIDRQFPLSLQQLAETGLWRCRLPRREKQLRLQQALADWHLEALADSPLQALSGGELQRALLARVQLTDSRLLLLDEPGNALDTAGQQLLWAKLKQWQASGKTLLVVCHDLLAVTAQCADILQIDPQGCDFSRNRTATAAPDQWQVA